MHVEIDDPVDGRTPAPPGMYRTLNNGINYLSTGAGFLPSRVSIDDSYLNTQSPILGPRQEVGIVFLKASQCHKCTQRFTESDHTPFSTVLTIL